MMMISMIKLNFNIILFSYNIIGIYWYLKILLLNLISLLIISYVENKNKIIDNF